MFHPFYVRHSDQESGGSVYDGEWKAASNLLAGDVLQKIDGSTVYVTEVTVEKLPEIINVYNLEIEDLHTYYVADGVLVHNGCDGDESLNNKNENRNSKTLKEWLKDNPELLEECTEWYNNDPEWWGIDPENTPVFLRTQDEVKKIRNKAGESGGHHPHGLALGGPEGQKLTETGETGKIKNKKHNKVTGLQRRVINQIKKQLK